MLALDFQSQPAVLVCMALQQRDDRFQTVKTTNLGIRPERGIWWKARHGPLFLLPTTSFLKRANTVAPVLHLSGPCPPQWIVRRRRRSTTLLLSVFVSLFFALRKMMRSRTRRDGEWFERFLANYLAAISRHKVSWRARATNQKDVVTTRPGV